MVLKKDFDFNNNHFTVLVRYREVDAIEPWIEVLYIAECTSNINIKKSRR